MNYDIEVKPAPKQSWFTPTEAKKYYGRYSRDGITVHWWGGGEQETAHDSIVNYFLAQGNAGVKSVNYVVSDAKITQMVDPDNVAWASQSGNPTTVSIEFEPGLSDQGYARGGWLIATLEKKYGKKLTLYPHKHWFATACPGTIDINRLRAEADKASGGSVPATPSAPGRPPAAVPSPGNQTVHLPASVATWAAYRVGSQYRKGTSDQVGTLLPSRFGGLTYKVVENRGNVVVIDTESYGRVAIWVAGTSAVLTSGAVQAQPAKPTGGTTVTFPASVATWRVYKLGSGNRPNTADQVGFLLPSQFGGLTYPIVENKGSFVVIDTQAFGRVQAWVAGTEAIIR